MALVTLPYKIIHPWHAIVGWRALGIGTVKLINDDTDKVAAIIQIPKSGLLTGVQFGTGTITTGENAVPIRIETIDGTTGSPSGTLAYTNANGTADIGAADDNVLLACTNINSSSGVTVAAGDLVAIVIARNASGTLNGNVMRYSAVGSGLASGFPYINDFNIGGAGVWTKTPAAFPCLSLNIGGAWVAPDGCLGGIINQATASFQSAAEQGVLVNLPFSFRVVGAIVALGMTAGTTVIVRLYAAPTTSPSVVANSATIDTDAAANTAAEPARFTFTTPYVCAANTNYVLAVSPQGAVNVGLNYLTANNTYNAAWPGGSTWAYYGRASGGATVFTETTARVPQIAIIIDQIDTGSGGPFRPFGAPVIAGAMR